MLRDPSAALGTVVLASAAIAYSLFAFAADDGEPQFRQQMHAAMARMDQAMSAPSSGNIDADFVAMMVPHHQAAIEMAQLQLRYGHNKQLARIAQEIIVDQQQEIAVMRRSLGDAP